MWDFVGRQTYHDPLRPTPTPSALNIGKTRGL
jgi:hypothetical protein